jgi:hypothetical protein
MDIAHTILTLAAVYLALGVLFSLFFVTIGIGRIDPAARGAGITFRILMIPASVILWPMLFLKTVRRHP